MLPTLNGRIQTRVATLLVLGGAWTAVVAPLLPVDLGVGARYRAAYLVLLTVLVLGVLWELVYHGLMQLRREKDWPALLGFATAVNEGALVWLLLSAGLVPGLPDGLPVGAFLLHFATTWIIVWFAVNGPMRVPFVHWRFRGGRLI